MEEKTINLFEVTAELCELYNYFYGIGDYDKCNEALGVAEGVEEILNESNIEVYCAMDYYHKRFKKATFFKIENGNFKLLDEREVN